MDLTECRVGVRSIRAKEGSELLHAERPAIIFQDTLHAKKHCLVQNVVGGAATSPPAHSNKQCENHAGQHGDDSRGTTTLTQQSF